MAQIDISQLDFDFGGYANQPFDRMVNNMYHPDNQQNLGAFAGQADSPLTAVHHLVNHLNLISRYRGLRL